MATTSQGAGSGRRGAPDTTKPAKLATGTQRAPTHSVQGPGKLPNSSKTMATPSGPPPLHRTPPAAVKPKEQSRSVPADAPPSMIGPASGY